MQCRKRPCVAQGHIFRLIKMGRQNFRNESQSEYSQICNTKSFSLHNEPSLPPLQSSSSFITAEAKCSTGNNHKFYPLIIIVMTQQQQRQTECHCSLPSVRNQGQIHRIQSTGEFPPTDKEKGNPELGVHQITVRAAQRNRSA